MSTTELEVKADHPAVREYKRRQQTILVDGPCGPQIVHPPVGSWTYLDLAALNEILGALGYTVERAGGKALFSVRRM